MAGLIRVSDELLDNSVFLTYQAVLIRDIFSQAMAVACKTAMVTGGDGSAENLMGISRRNRLLQVLLLKHMLPYNGESQL